MAYRVRPVTLRLDGAKAAALATGFGAPLPSLEPSPIASADAEARFSRESSLLASLRALGPDAGHEGVPFSSGTMRSMLLEATRGTGQLPPGEARFVRKWAVRLKKSDGSGQRPQKPSFRRYDIWCGASQGNLMSYRLKLGFSAALHVVVYVKTPKTWLLGQSGRPPWRAQGSPSPLAAP